MNPRDQLATWWAGDRELLASHFRGATRVERDAVEDLRKAYAAKFPDAHPVRVQYEAILDVCAASLGKTPTGFLDWLKRFDEAATEIMEGWNE